MKITDEMIEAGCAAIGEARGYKWPGDFDDDETKTGRENMRLALTAALSASPAGVKPKPLQSRVQPWMMACFGPEISADKLERSDRFIEEALELVQSGYYPKERVLALVDYVYGRDKGEMPQEVGGVMITLAAFCLAHDIDMHEAGETELARIWTKVEKIRAKQAAKPTGSALPVAIEPAGVGVETAAPQTHVDWSGMAKAPKDGTMLRLLVNPDKEEFTAFDDSLTPFETVGFNNLADTGEDRWEFAGWDWQQDCFITGRGEVIGWAEMSPKPDGSAATSEYKPVVCVGRPTIDKLTSGEHVETEKVILIPASDLSPPPSTHVRAMTWRYRADDKAMWQYAEGARPVLSGWIVEPLYDIDTMAEAVAAVSEMVRLADMGLEEALKEPEENGCYAAYQRAKRFLEGTPSPQPRAAVTKEATHD